MVIFALSQSVGFMKKSWARARLLVFKLSRLSVFSCSICCRSRETLSVAAAAATAFTVGVRAAAFLFCEAAVGVGVALEA
jgi:hypothetical protein